MRSKWLLSFLMLLMLTPGLVCGGMLCMGKAQAATAVTAQDVPPCHQQDGDNTHGNKGVMLYNDCAKADLSAVDHEVLKKPDLNGTVFFTAWAGVAPVIGFEYVADHAIRAPPPEWRGLSLVRPSILLTTQRFRE